MDIDKYSALVAMWVRITTAEQTIEPIVNNIEFISDESIKLKLYKLQDLLNELEQNLSDQCAYAARSNSK